MDGNRATTVSLILGALVAAIGYAAWPRVDDRASVSVSSERASSGEDDLRKAASHRTAPEVSVSSVARTPQRERPQPSSDKGALDTMALRSAAGASGSGDDEPHEEPAARDDEDGLIDYLRELTVGWATAAPNPALSEQRAADIAARLQEGGLSAALRSIDCREDVCRVEMKFDSDTDARLAIAGASRQRALLFSQEPTAENGRIAVAFSTDRSDP